MPKSADDHLVQVFSLLGKILQQLILCQPYVIFTLPDAKLVGGDDLTFKKESLTKDKLFLHNLINTHGRILEAKMTGKYKVSTLRDVSTLSFSEGWMMVWPIGAFPTK